MRDFRSLVRLALPVVLILAVAVLLQARGKLETIPARQPLAGFPRELGGWQARDVAIAQDVRDVLGSGDFLARVYTTSPNEPYIDLFLAYFPSQRTGKAIHSPKNCLPGSGWAPAESSHIPIPRPDGSQAVVNRYIIAKGIDRQLVLYWYQAHDRVMASEYWAKFFLVSDAMTMNRSDGALVRVVTPILPSEEAAVAEKRAVAFARLVLPELGPYIPR